MHKWAAKTVVIFDKKRITSFRKSGSISLLKDCFAFSEKAKEISEEKSSSVQILFSAKHLEVDCFCFHYKLKDVKNIKYHVKKNSFTNVLLAILLSVRKDWRYGLQNMNLKYQKNWNQIQIFGEGE